MKEKDILQYTMKGLSLSYRKKKSSTSFHIRNVIECAFNISYPVFSPIVKSFSVDDINHSIEKKDIIREQRWKKYQKSSGYRISSTKKATFNFNYVDKQDR